MTDFDSRLQPLQRSIAGLVGAVDLAQPTAPSESGRALEFRSEPAPFLWSSDAAAIGSYTRGLLLGGVIVGGQRVLAYTGNLAAHENLLKRILGGDETPIPALNETFALAFWDAAKQELCLVTDRYGSLPLYYSWDQRSGVRGQVPGPRSPTPDPRPSDFRILFGSEVKAILAGLGTRGVLNRTALGELLWFGYTLSDITLFQDVVKVPPATILRFTRDGMKTEHYWRMNFIREGATSNAQSTVEAAETAFRAAVADCFEAKSGAVIALSGGLDSRAVFAETIGLGIGFDSFTTGVADAADVTIARRLSSFTRGTHHECIVGPELLANFEEHARRLVLLSEGTIPIQEAHLIHQVEWTCDRFGLIVDGSCSEPMKRGHQRRAGRSLRTHDQLREHLSRNWGDPGLARLVFESAEFEELAEHIRRTEQEFIEQTRQELVGDTIDYLFLRTAWPNRFGPQIALQNNYVASRLPYTDYRVMDATVRIPCALREKAAFHFYVVKKHAPSLKSVGRVFGDTVIPWTDSPLLKYPPLVLNRLMHRLGLPGLDRPNFHFSRWWRNELREGVVAALQSLERRNVLSGDGVQQLLKPDSMSRPEYDLAAGRLWMLELWFQSFVD